MYEKDFFERLNLQQLCAFLRTGGRLSPKAVEHGTLWERIRRAEDAWEAAMKAYRDKILTTDWSDLPPRGEAAVLEELQGGIMDAECRLESLYFEAGFHAGIRIGWELAAALENWYAAYLTEWRSVSKETTLRRTQQLICRYADTLRLNSRKEL